MMNMLLEVISPGTVNDGKDVGRVLVEWEVKVDKLGMEGKGEREGWERVSVEGSGGPVAWVVGGGGGGGEAARTVS